MEKEALEGLYTVYIIQSEEKDKLMEKLTRVNYSLDLLTNLILDNGGVLPGSSSSKNELNIDIPSIIDSTYAGLTNYEQRIIYALSKLAQPSTSMDVENYIKSQLPISNHPGVSKSVRLKISRLKRYNIIGYKDDGNKRLYYLK